MTHSSSAGSAWRGLIAAAVTIFAVVAGCAAPGDAPPSADPGDDSQWGTAAAGAQACGDGRCRGGETCSSCPDDCGACPPRCGDRTCNGQENCDSCPGDCGACSCNNNGFCEASRNETPANCPGDCIQSQCGNNQCESGESCSSCPQDCRDCVPGSCGDGLCNFPSENQYTCNQDCGPTRCGDGTCDLIREDMYNCYQDCPCQHLCPRGGLGTNCVPNLGPCS